MDEYDGKIRLVIKNYPYKYRDFSHMAAEASLAARDQGKYWEMHDMLFANSPKLDRESLISYAKAIGLDMRKFTESLDGMKHLAEIERDKKLAIELDLYNTPAFFVNGRLFIGDRPFEYMKRIIDEEMEIVKAKTASGK